MTGERVQVCPAEPRAQYGRDGAPVRVDGELSIQNADSLHRLFSEVLSRGPVLTVDFAGVQTCDTAVLQLICSLRKTALRRGVGLRIAALSPAIEAAAGALGLPVAELAGAGGTGADSPDSSTGGAGRGI